MINTFHLIHNIDNSYGGPAKSIPYLMGSLNDLGHYQEVISLSFSDKETNDVITKLGLNSKSFKVWFFNATAYSPKLKGYLVKRIMENDNQIIHYHNLWNYIPIVANEVAQKLSVPIVVSPRGNLYDWNLNKGFLKKKIYLDLFQREFFNNANCIHVTSKQELFAVKKLGYKSPIGLINNGINLSEFSNMKTKKEHLLNLNLSDDFKYILYMGRIEKKKGLNYLFEAYVDFVKNNENWKIIVAGPEYDKAYTNRCKEYIKNAGYEDSIIWLGMVSGQKRIDAYGAADLFVLPTHSENFGIVIAEALAAGLPVITTNGTPWMEIEDQHAGYIISLSTKNLLSAIKRFNNLNDYEKDEMSIAAKNIAKKYSWDKPAEEMELLYQWILGKAKQPKFIY